MNLIHSCLKRLISTYVSVLYTRFVQWTKPPTCSLPLGTLADLARSKSELMAENALLRQQLIMLKRHVKRPTCTKTDRILLVLLARAVRAWKQALFIVQPETLLRWHREAYRLFWRRWSKVRATDPRISPETIALINEMAVQNRRELLKLGMQVPPFLPTVVAPTQRISLPRSWNETNGGKNTLRQRLARFVRLTLSFSKSVVMHEACLLLFLHRYNLDLAILLK